MIPQPCHKIKEFLKRWRYLLRSQSVTFTCNNVIILVECTYVAVSCLGATREEEFSKLPPQGGTSERPVTF